MCVPDGVDPQRTIFIGLIHDMAESVVGDIAPSAGISKALKHNLEQSGIQCIESLLQPFDPRIGANIRAAWEEYEAGTTREAQYAREFDKLECLIQAFEYERDTYGEKEGLEEFQDLIPKIQSEQGKAWVKVLQQERQSHKSSLKHRSPVIFVNRSPGVDKKTLCNLLSKDFGFRHISLDELLLQKSEDPTYPHAQYVKDCLQRKMKVATFLAVDLLAHEIKQQTTWSFVLDFPECMEQLVEFEKKVQKANYVLSFCGASDTLGNRDFEASFYDIKERLKAEEGYFKEISYDGPLGDIYSSVKKTVEEIIQHAELKTVKSL